MTGFTKLHMGLMVLVKKMLVPNHFLLQNINLVAVHILLVIVKCRGYHISESSWEPKSHLTPEIIRTYDQSEMTYERLQYAAQNLEREVQQRLSSNGNRSVLDFDADLFRFYFGVQSIHILHKEDYSRLPLSNSWHYKLKRNGRGSKLSFPVRLHSNIHIRKSYMNVRGIVHAS